MYLFLFYVMLPPGTDLNRQGRNGQGIFSAGYPTPVTFQ